MLVSQYLLIAVLHRRKRQECSQLGLQVILDKKITGLPAKDILRFLVAVATVRQVGRAEKCFALARKFRLHSAL